MQPIRRVILFIITFIMLCVCELVTVTYIMLFFVSNFCSPMVYEETEIVGQDGQIYKGRVTRKKPPPYKVGFCVLQIPHHIINYYAVARELAVSSPVLPVYKIVAGTLHRHSVIILSIAYTCVPTIIVLGNVL